jgi:hypothetical protein
MNLAYKPTGSIASLKLVRAYPLRAALVWVGIHGFAAVSLGEVDSLGFTGTIVLAAVAAAVLTLDAKRRRELRFLVNLGVPPWLPAVTGIATILLFESLLSTLA